MTINENNKLKTNENKYKEIIGTNQAIELSQDMEQIKKLKHDINHFLFKNGIHI